MIRLDDACPTMDNDKWSWFENLFDEFRIKPIMSVIPCNEDPMMKIGKKDPRFWDRVRDWQNKGYEIALHGYDHVYTTARSGIVPLNNFSEFAGLPIEAQKIKIRAGIALLEKEKIRIRTWVAPGHSFDCNTLIALKEESNISVISDGIALQPFRKYGFLWVPQQLWGPILKEKHTWTICYHPNVTSKKQFLQLKTFIEQNKDRFISLQDVLESDLRPKQVLSEALFRYSFFLKKSLRKKLKNV